MALKRVGKITEAREALLQSKALQAEAEAKASESGKGGRAHTSEGGGTSLQDASRDAMNALEEDNVVLRASVNVQRVVESEENECDPELLDDLRIFFNANDPSVGGKHSQP